MKLARRCWADWPTVFNTGKAPPMSVDRTGPNKTPSALRRIPDRRPRRPRKVSSTSGAFLASTWPIKPLGTLARMGKRRGADLGQAWSQQRMRQIVGGLAQVRNTVELRGAGAPKRRQLREHIPHPVRLLPARAHLGQRHGHIRCCASRKRSRPAIRLAPVFKFRFPSRASSYSRIPGRFNSFSRAQASACS